MAKARQPAPPRARRAREPRASSRRARRAAARTPRRSPSRMDPTRLSRRSRPWSARPAARRSAPIASRSAAARCCSPSLPFAAVQPTPFQRDLSPTHAKRLARRSTRPRPSSIRSSWCAARTDNCGRPTAATGSRPRRCWACRQITALISPDESLAYRILALNTEKAHNLKDRSLEVIRMARSLAKRRRHATHESAVRRGVRGRRAADARHRVREVSALRRRRLQLVSEEGRSLQRRSHSPSACASGRTTPRGSSRSTRGEAHHRRAADAAASSPRTCATTWSRASIPVRFHKAKKGDDQAADAARAGAHAHGGRGAKGFKVESVSNADLAWVAVGAGGD